MLLHKLRWAYQVVREGHGKFLLADAFMRSYKQVHELSYTLRFRVARKLPGSKDYGITVKTEHPVAYKSPDHLIPRGTKADNSTNKKFVTHMAKLLTRERPGGEHGLLDLGCSGGQLVKDFAERGWMAVGLEGSDYSLKHRRANWPALGGKNLFTCDITKPFEVQTHGRHAKFDLITLWEVLEHIAENDLPQLFRNILEHMEKGGYLIASTTSVPDVQNGVDLHQTKWPNAEWRKMIQGRFPELELVDLGLKYYQFVRHNEERSFLTYRRVP
jgi:2-polyprenyl-3-methyl-5-hydroxy-6-metoxy-1,4-benzoquinol methylase